MAKLILAKTFKNRIKNGKLDKKRAAALTILESFDLGFVPKRVYWLYSLNNKEVRGGHRHKKVKHALICVNGGCEVSVNNGIDQNKLFKLDRPDKCLLLKPRDWHTMEKFKKGTVLLVLASTNYNPRDYIYEPYKRK
jgi:hypothetical protein